MKVLLSCVGLLVATPAFAWDPFSVENDRVEEGNRLLRSKNFQGALDAYGRAARELPEEPGVHLNRGLAQQDLAEQASEPEAQERLRAGARDSLRLATDPSAPRETRAMAYHDLGNIFFDEENWQEAINQYRRSLRLRPGNRDTQWNLELAGRMMQQEQEEQQQEQQQEEEQQEEQEQRSEGDNDQQRQPQPENQGQGGQQQGTPQDRQEQEQPQQGTGEQAERPNEPEPQEDERRPDRAGANDQPAQARSRQEMDSVLDALEQDEQHLERERARARARLRERRVDRDW